MSAFVLCMWLCGAIGYPALGCWVLYRSWICFRAHDYRRCGYCIVTVCAFASVAILEIRLLYQNYPWHVSTF